MTELDILKRAAMYIKKMANGINPLTDDVIDEDDFVNNVRISRCLFYVSDVLEKVIRNDGVIQKPSRTPKIPFAVSDERLKYFKYSETPIALSSIADRFNDLIDSEIMKKISYKVLADWLLSQDILMVTEGTDGKAQKVPTSKGLSIGLSVIQKIGQRGNQYDVIVYDIEAQKYIVQNISNVLNSNK